MQYVPFSYKSKDRLTLQARAWLSENFRSKGTVYLIHDLGEHSARYAHVGEDFSEKYYNFISFDLRGHGLSGGQRGHCSKFINLMNDIEGLICQSEKQLGLSHEQRILYGQGLGANLALNYVLRRKPHISGLILTSPILNTPITKSKIKRTILQIIANTFPKIRFSHHIKGEKLSRDLAFVKAYHDDVYNHKKISVRFALDIYRSGKYALANANKIDLPLLLMHGTDDAITPASISKTLAEKVGKMADILLWENAYHELHNDIEKDLVIRKMIEWLKKEIK